MASHNTLNKPEAELVQENAPAQHAARPSLLKVFFRGIWSDNPGLCQLLGLCPLLAVTSSATSALGLGIATFIVMVTSSVIISLLHVFIIKSVRIPLYIVLIATLVTVLRFYIQSYFPDLFEQLGIYLSLIVTNCIIMGRAEAYAGRNWPIRALADASGSGLGFALVLFALGSVREILGSGTFMQGGHELLGQWAMPLQAQVLSADHTYLIAILPPGGFFVLALFIALKNAWSMHVRHREEKRFEIKSIRT
ncbi:MAG: electron transport complex subunit E [Succinivibrio sp.]|nr:electron transport complex subunit E [Succinivibrio sp.]